jgi:signal peptidase I
MKIEDKLAIGTLIIAVVILIIISLPKNFIIVQGSSMETYLPNGCLVAVQEPVNISYGDVIIFTNKFNFSGIHRVVGYCPGGFVTKGDNNWGDDGCTLNSSIKSKMLWKLC